jgi:hypothetical protein
VEGIIIVHIKQDNIMLTINSADLVLANIVDYVDGTENEIDITLALSGILVSGKLVSGHRLIAHLKDRLIIDQPYSDNMKDMHNKQLEIFLSAHESNYKKGKDVIGGAVFVHLLDARFHNGSGKDLGRRPAHFWRGTLEQVVGFHLE